MHTLRFTTTGRKNLSRLPAKMQERIHAKLKALCADPFSEALDIKKLQGQSYYRLRVGDYRIVYDLQHEHITILVLDIGHRKEIYH